MFTSVKIECKILVLEISLLGKNYLVIRILWLNCWPKTKDNSYAIHSAFYNHVNSLFLARLALAESGAPIDCFL